MNDLKVIRVLAVDDNLQWREVLALELLERSVYVVGTAGDGLEAVRKARVLQPDLIIMDLWMPELNGLDATREIAAVAPASRILIVSSERDPGIVDAAFAAGAHGYVLKSQVPTELLKAIDAVVGGDMFLGRGLTRTPG